MNRCVSNAAQDVNTRTPMLRIVSVSFAECSIPLPQPVRLGKSEIRTRDFLALRVETDGGFAGEAIGYVRGTPLYRVMENIADRLLESDALMRREIVSGLDASNIPGRSALTRALSLLDIALWDISAKFAGLPLFQLIGGIAENTPVTAVTGYYMDVRTVDDISAEVERRFNEGFSRVKVMLHGGAPRFDQQLVEALASFSGRIAADAHWSWSTLTDACRYCRPLDALGLEFLEDPFPATDWRLSHELQKRMHTPVAAGEDVFGAAQIDQLVRGIGVLRIDATTCGGITGAIEAINIAAAAGRTVLPHVFVPIHAHLACAFPNVEGVEVIPTDVGADPLDVLTRNNPSVIDGTIRPSTEPGVGFCLDWESINSFALQARKIDVS